MSMRLDFEVDDEDMQRWCDEVTGTLRSGTSRYIEARTVRASLIPRELERSNRTLSFFSIREEGSIIGYNPPTSTMTAYNIHVSKQLAPNKRVINQRPANRNPGWVTKRVILNDIGCLNPVKISHSMDSEMHCFESLHEIVLF